MKLARVLRLESPAPDGVVHFLCDRVDARALAEDGRRSVVTVTRTGTFYDPRYGEFDITRSMLLAMVRNFEAGTYGQEVVIDVSHRPEDGAAGFVRRLFLSGNKLRAEIEWTDYGRDAVTKKGFIYLSAEFHEDWKDNEKRQAHGPTLLGAALTTRPVIKGLDKVQLSNDQLQGAEHVRLSEESLHTVPTYLSDRIIRLMHEDHSVMLKELLRQLKRELSAVKLNQDLITQLMSAFEKAGEKLTDEATLQLLCEQFIDAGKETAKQLAEAANSGNGDRPIKLDISIPEIKAGGLDAEGVKKLLAEEAKKADELKKQLAENRDARVAQFHKLIDDNEGLKSLSEASLKGLKAAADVITADWTEDSVKALADTQIALGDQMVVHAKRAGLGLPGPAGNVHIQVDESNQVKELQEGIDRRLGFADQPDSRRFARTGGQLQAENKKLAELVLSRFDREHEAQLAAEHKSLAAGDGLVSDVAVPAIYERTVIREALYGLSSMMFMNAGSTDFAESISIPYSYRDTTAAGRSSARKYEGQSIARAGVIQTSELAYPIPQKLAFEISDELRYLTGARRIDYDAVAENVRNAARIISEDTEHLNYNEILAASHEYGATAVSGEDLELQADDTKKVFILANFPVVRPRSRYDLQGNLIGSVLHPVTVTYNSVARAEYDSEGSQAAGIYYVLDYDLGEIYLVDESGAIQTPADGTAFTISYSYTTNVYKFDTDLGSSTLKDKEDDFLYRYGLRKSVIEDGRFYMANFGVMSGNTLTSVGEANRFAANFKVPGTDLNADGNLGRIKDVANYKTSAPGLHIGDRYAVIGERGVSRFRMLRPWSMGQMENQKDANGRFTGKKEAYGDQFVVVHTPTQLKAAYTSILRYSASARVARVAP